MFSDASEGIEGEGGEAAEAQAGRGGGGGRRGAALHRRQRRPKGLPSGDSALFLKGFWPNGDVTRANGILAARRQMRLIDHFTIFLASYL